MTKRTDEVWRDASLAAVYLEGVRAAIPLAAEQIDVMLRLIAACNRPVRKVLDLGCGDGVLAAAVLRRFPEAAATLADFSPAMLEAATRRFAADAARVRVVEIDYGAPTWPARVEGPFDAIVSGYSIHHQPDERKREIYGEILALLAPGGIFVNVEHVASPSAWVEGLHNELFIDALAAHHSGKAREEVAAIYYNRGDKSSNILAPVGLQCQWLRETGFTDVDCYLKVFELAVFGGRKPAA